MHKTRQTYYRGDDDKESLDVSLRGQALRRAVQAELPKTLTPYEWEQWYAEHGVPRAHLQAAMKPRKRWWHWSWFGSSGKDS